MRWFWRKDPEPLPPRANGAKARAALAQSAEDLRAARGQWQAVLSVVADIRAIRRENHFAEKVAETMRRRGDL